MTPLRVFLAGVLTSLAVGSAVAQTGPKLAAAHNSSQGWLPRLTATAIADGVTDFRDGMRWREAEIEGAYTFAPPTAHYPDMLFREGAGLTLTLNAGHPDHDGGHTPHTPEGVAAFARFAAETVRRFPAIHSVEVGNEHNAQNFVSGPVREAGIDARARYHLALLKATYRAVKDVNPEVRVLGGAAHSISGRYLADLFALGAGAYMDALALHPYTTPVDLLTREIAWMRQSAGIGSLEVEVTEFGYQGGTRPAADHFLRSYCAFALSGVTRAAWYPLHPRGDGFAPLYTRDGSRTDVGAAYHLIRTELEGAQVHDVSPDPFTHACAFGPPEAPTHLVLWGAPRAVFREAGVIARDATGAMLEPSEVTEERPLVFSTRSGGAVRLGVEVTLGAQPRLADSFLQFGHVRDTAGRAEGDTFLRLVRTGGDAVPLRTRPGQDRDGVPWRPYLALPEGAVPRLTETVLVPSRGPGGAMEIVHRYIAPTSLSAILDLRVAPGARSADGVTVTVDAGDRRLLDVVVSTSFAQRLPVQLKRGTALDIAVSPGDTADGDVAEYRFVVER